MKIRELKLFFDTKIFLNVYGILHVHSKLAFKSFTIYFKYIHVGTDRSNMVEMQDPSVNYPLTSGQTLTMFPNAKIVWTSNQETKTNEDLALSMASSGYYSSVSQYKKKTALNNELNNAPASYRGMLLKFAPGSYYYMCTRNNNFSNRNQKGRLLVRR